MKDTSITKLNFKDFAKGLYIKLFDQKQKVRNIEHISRR